jgi:ribosome-associated protein
MKTKNIKIDTEYIKLQDLLKLSGEAYTGGMAKVVIQNGEVKVNGEVCEMRGKKLRPGDTAEYSGVIINIE